MLAVLQRVSQAAVSVDDNIIGQINKGLVIFLCVVADDNQDTVLKLVNKITKLRIFADENDKMNKSLIDINGECLIISQFTLAADIKKGNRPSFTNSADPKLANDLYEAFCQEVNKLNINVQQGKFGANMNVSLNNDGPVTILIDSSEL